MEDGFELAQELIRQPGAQDRGEQRQAGEGMVDGGGSVLRELQLLLQVQRQDGVHSSKSEQEEEYSSQNEEDAVGIPRLKGCK